MEGQKTEDWWSGENSKYSLKHYKEMPIYQRFKSSSKPFSKIMGEYREAFWRDDNCFIFEWYDSPDQKGEKFGLDLNSTTYFYEHWYIEDDIHIVEKSWLCDSVEWGVIIKYYPEYEEEITWSTENEKKVIETRTKKDGKIELKKKGQNPTPEGLEDFTELFWETPTGYAREKVWTRGEAKGEDKEYKDGDKKWGESWIESDDLVSKKTWNEEGSRKWGEATGEEGYEKWHEKWEKNSEGSFEELVIDDRCQNRGKLRVRSNSKSYQIEWEGEKPEISNLPKENLPSAEAPKASPLEKPKSLTKGKDKKLRSGRPADRTQVKFEDPESLVEPSGLDPVSPRRIDLFAATNTEKLAAQLSSLFKDLKKDVSARAAELKSSEAFKINSSEFAGLLDEIKELKDPNPFDPQDSLAGIQALRDIDRRLLGTEKNLLAKQPTSDQLKGLFDQSVSAVLSLAPTLDPSNISQTPGEVQKLSKRFEASSGPKEKLGVISALVPKIHDLLKASQKEVEDHQKELADLSFKLSPVLVTLEKAVKESMETLVKIKESLAKDKETIDLYITGFETRAEDWKNSVNSSQPFTESIPQVSSLLTDIEKLKKELLETNLPLKLKDLESKLSEINSDLLKNLGSEPQSSSTPSQNLHDLLDTLNREAEKAKVLVDKTLGKDVKTGDKELDSIKALSNEGLNIDPSELLKNLWIDGKTALDNINITLNQLADQVGHIEDKEKTIEIIHQNELSVTGKTPESKTEALLQLSHVLEEFLPSLCSSSELLKDLADKVNEKNSRKDLKRALMISDKITEKLMQDKEDEFRSALDSISDQSSTQDLQKALLKSQEVNLGLINNDEELTKIEVTGLEAQTKTPKKKPVMKKGNKKALRSGRTEAKKILNFSDPAGELVEASFKTTSELAFWVLGSRQNITRQLELLKNEKEFLLEKIHSNFNEESMESFLSYLKKLEDAKQGTYNGAEVSKNLEVIEQKCEKVLTTAAKLLEKSVPAEVEEIRQRTISENLPDSSKKIIVYLNLFFKMVKDATGVDEGGENLEDALSEIRKKKVASLLPFDSEDLLNYLKGKSQKEVKRLNFLAGLIGSDEDIENSNQLAEQAENTLPVYKHHLTPQESLVQIDNFLHYYPEISQKIDGKIAEFLQKLIEKLVNPEPLEKDVSNLITSVELLDKTAQGLCSSAEQPVLAELQTRKEHLPSTSKELIPYLSSLNKDYSSIVLKLTNPLSPEEENKLQSAIKKKINASPVQILKDTQHPFSGPDTEDMVSIIIKLHKVADYLSKAHTVGNPALYSMCSKDFARLSWLGPSEVKALGKDYADLLLSLTDQELDTEEEDLILKKRVSLKRKAIPWDSIIHSKGLDLDSGLLCEIIDEEQRLASIYLPAISKYLGNSDQKQAAESYIMQSKEILKDLDIKSKIENYFQLRLEESKLASSLSSRLSSVFERITDLDNEKEAVLNKGLAEVQILVDQNNPFLKDQVSTLIQKESEYKLRSPDNVPEFLIRLINRLSLEKELIRIKEEAAPKQDGDGEVFKALSSIETSLYKELKGLNQFLQNFSAELLPGTKSLKHLTEQHVSGTTTALLASVNAGIQSHVSLLQAVNSILDSSPVKSTLKGIIKLIQVEMPKDDQDTETVFAGLLKLCGSADDKSASKKLRESRQISLEEKNTVNDLALVVYEGLAKVLPARSSQSKLQSKLIREMGKIREGVDELDFNSEEKTSKAMRETGNSIMSEDSAAKAVLDKIKKNLEKLNGESPSNIFECIDRIDKRMQVADEIEKLRKELKDKTTREMNKLKGDLQDKSNEVSNAKASLAAQKTNYDAQITLLQNTADLNASLVEKLTAEAVEKEKTLSSSKNTIADLKAKFSDAEEEAQRVKEDLDLANQELRNLRKANKEKETQIRDLSSSLDHYERTSDKITSGEKEKVALLDKIREENRGLRSELDEKQKLLDESRDALLNKDRAIKKYEQDKNSQESEIENLKNDRNKAKSEAVKLRNDLAEIKEKMKLNEGSDDIRQLEKILEDKQKELEEAEIKLTVAKRYQILYPEITAEKQELENKLRDISIDFQELARKHDDGKAENDQLKFKLSNCENLAKSTEEALKENQKLKIRINFLEQSSSNKDLSDQIKKLCDEITEKDQKIKDLLEEIERLKKQLQAQLKKHIATLNRNFLIRLCQAFKESQRFSFAKWRNYKVQKEVKIDLAPATREETKDETEKALEKSAEEAFSSNKLIIYYKEARDLNEKSLSYLNIFKFLEELMDSKYEADKLCSSTEKPLVSIPDFMIEFLNRTFGVKSLAVKFLAQFIPGFHEIFKEGHKYAVFYARMLQLFHPQPVPIVLAVFVVKARMEFHQIIEKYERSFSEKELIRKDSRVGYDTAGNGGRALLGDAIELVYNMFQGDSEGGEMLLELIKPEKISMEDYVAFNICHKMVKLGKTPEMIFSLLDKNRAEKIEVSEFSSGIKGDLNLWISQKNIESLRSVLSANTEEISKESFMSKINMKFLLDCNKNSAWTATKCDFLTALLDVFSVKQRKLMNGLNEKAKPSGVFTKEVFISAVNELDPSVESALSTRMYDEAQDKEKDVRLQAAGEVISKYGLGSLSSFKSKELLHELSRRKLIHFSEDESVKVTVQTVKKVFFENDVKIERDEEEKTIIRKKVIKKLVKRIVG